MHFNRTLQSAALAVAALLALPAAASASIVTFNTDAAGTMFVGDSLTLASSSGQSAILTFVPDSNSTIGVPTNVNYGIFNLTCATCGTLASGTGAFFNAFTFDLVITDTSDGATGEFTGSSTGGNVYSDVSQININWVPLQLGSGTNNATTGNFGTTYFDITSTTRIVSPNSGAVPGQTTVQGSIASTASVVSAVPEPASIFLLGSGLIAVGVAGRKKLRVL